MYIPEPFDFRELVMPTPMSISMPVQSKLIKISRLSYVTRCRRLVYSAWSAWADFLSLSNWTATSYDLVQRRVH